MHDPRGSIWRKWDLHVHTPASLVNDFGSADEAWEKWLDAIEDLPPEVSVIGINDYLFLDGYIRVLAEKEKGRLSNIDLFLPVIELRLDKFGGSRNRLSRVNYHVIFSNDVAAQVIQSQFLTALTRSYVLSPEYQGLQSQWQAVPTRESLADLGQMIIDSVPAPTKRRHKRRLYAASRFNGLMLVGASPQLNTSSSQSDSARSVCCNFPIRNDSWNLCFFHRVDHLHDPKIGLRTTVECLNDDFELTV